MMYIFVDFIDKRVLSIWIQRSRIQLPEALVKYDCRDDLAITGP